MKFPNPISKVGTERKKGAVNFEFCKVLTSQIIRLVNDSLKSVTGVEKDPSNLGFGGEGAFGETERVGRGEGDVKWKIEGGAPECKWEAMQSTMSRVNGP